MQEHYLILAGLGFATIIMAWLPAFSEKLKISSPIVLLLIGFGLFAVGLPLGWPDPLWNDLDLMYFSEALVIISLMGAGLKMGENSLKAWRKPLLLVFITMPICMLSAFLLGQYFLLLSVPSSLLLAAVLAPTDPVLAAEVQLDDPLEEEEGHEDDIRFTLTAEAGLNDGIAFPFSYLAVLVAQAGSWAAFNFSDWFWDKLILKVVIGVIAGLFIGWLIGMLMDRLYKYVGVKTFVGFLALSLTFMTYGATELIHGYGFLAVFFAGFSLRYYEKVDQNYKKKLHDFIQEMEHLFMVIYILLFGGSIMNGMLNLTDWKGIVFAFIFVLLVRPLAGLIALAGFNESFKSKLAVSFFGIRGIGSIFYLSWAFVSYDYFDHKNELYAITAYIILISIILHGFTAPSVIGHFKNRDRSKPETQEN